MTPQEELRDAEDRVLALTRDQIITVAARAAKLSWLDEFGWDRESEEVEAAWNAATTAADTAGRSLSVFRYAVGAGYPRHRSAKCKRTCDCRFEGVWWESMRRAAQAVRDAGMAGCETHTVHLVMLAAKWAALASCTSDLVGVTSVRRPRLAPWRRQVSVYTGEHYELLTRAMCPLPTTSPIPAPWETQ
jgi:hypothetical protein